MIDGIWWLVILLAIVIALWIIAKSRDADSAGTTAKSNSISSSMSKKPHNDALQKTLKLIKQNFVDYKVIRNGNHLLISRQGKKIAMITIDKKLAVGQRRLGEVPIINYHKVPTRAQLTANLQNAE